MKQAWNLPATVSRERRNNAAVPSHLQKEWEK